MHRRAAGNRHRLGDVGGKIGADVGLVQHDHRPRAAASRDDEITFEGAFFDVDVESEGKKDDVNVGRKHLLGRAAPGGLARKPAPSRQDGANQHPAARLIGSNADPVADGGQLVPALGLELDLAGSLGQPFRVRGEHAIDVIVLERHAPWHQSVGLRGPRRVEPRVPPQRLETGPIVQIEGSRHGAEVILTRVRTQDPKPKFRDAVNR
jgi:hypothetical protein